MSLLNKNLSYEYLSYDRMIHYLVLWTLEKNGDGHGHGQSHGHGHGHGHGHVSFQVT
jgi:hypothetical protein